MIEPTTMDDITAIVPAEGQDMDWRAIFMDMADAATLEAYLTTYCRTVWLHGKMIAIAGVTPLWDHVGEIWLCPSEHAKDHRLYLARTLFKLLDIAQDVLKAHRIQLTVGPNDMKKPDWRELVARLGFRSEGTLRSYIHAGEDYELFSRIWP